MIKDVLPSIFIERFEVGGAVDGSDPAGSAFKDSAQTIKRGRYRVLSGLDNGGLVDIQVGNLGYRMMYFSCELQGISDIQLSIIDIDNFKVSVGDLTLTNGRGYVDFRDGGVLIPPDCKLEVAGTGLVSVKGEFLLGLNNGWSPSMYAENYELGKSVLPPSPEYN